VAFAGMFWEPLRPIYDWSWFVGFGRSGALLGDDAGHHPTSTAKRGPIGACRTFALRPIVRTADNCCGFMPPYCRLP